MLEEFVEKIISLSGVEQHKFGDRNYTDKKIYPVTPPKADPIVFNTLDALVGYAKKYADPKIHFLFVENFDRVELTSNFNSNWREREILAVSSTRNYETDFSFNRFYPKEDFLIKVSSQFECSAARTKLLQFLGTATSEVSETVTDDGVSQSVSAKQGITLQSRAKVPNPLVLSPYRTFPDLDQPKSQFLFRIQDERRGEGIECALFESEGKMWKIRAINEIGKYLTKELKDFQVLS